MEREDGYAFDCRIPPFSLGRIPFCFAIQCALYEEVSSLYHCFFLPRCCFAMLHTIFYACMFERSCPKGTVFLDGFGI